MGTIRDYAITYRQEGGVRLRRLLEGVIDFKGNNQLGIVEGVGITSES